MSVKILLRNSVPANVSEYPLKLENNQITQGTRKYTLNTKPGYYLVMPFIAQGSVPHYNNVQTYTIDNRAFKHSKENLPFLNSTFFNGYIAAYIVEENGNVILLINTSVAPDESIKDICEQLTKDRATLTNDQVLQFYTNEVPSIKFSRFKRELLLKTNLNDIMANMQLQIDVLVSILKDNPPANKPEWFDKFISAMSSNTEVSIPLDRKGIENVIEEIAKDRKELNLNIKEYKDNIEKWSN